MPRLSPLALRGGCTLLLGLAACGGQSPPPDPAPVAVPDTQPLPAPAPAVVRVDASLRRSAAHALWLSDATDAMPAMPPADAPA